MTIKVKNNHRIISKNCPHNHHKCQKKNKNKVQLTKYCHRTIQAIQNNKIYKYKINYI